MGVSFGFSGVLVGFLCLLLGESISYCLRFSCATCWYDFWAVGGGVVVTKAQAGSHVGG